MSPAEEHVKRRQIPRTPYLILDHTPRALLWLSFLTHTRVKKKKSVCACIKVPLQHQVQCCPSAELPGPGPCSMHGGDAQVSPGQPPPLPVFACQRGDRPGHPGPSLPVLLFCKSMGISTGWRKTLWWSFLTPTYSSWKPHPVRFLAPSLCLLGI